METREITEIWNNLNTKTHVEIKPYINIRIVPDSQYDLFLGIDTQRNQKLLLIKIHKINDPDSEIFPKSKGFAVNKLRFSDDIDEFITIGLILLDNKYLDFFTILVKDVITYMVLEKTENKMICTFLSRLKIWQQFLDRCGNDGLSREEQIGLYGELRLLNDYLIPLLSPGKAISSWIGPENGRQDFQIAGMAVEVKTGSGKNDEIIHISSEDQLDDSGLRALFLYYLSIREIRDNITTLPNLIDQIKEKIDDDQTVKDKFEVLLMKAGYLEEHRDKYAENAYSARSVNFYQVTGEFPRIVRKHLAQGIGNVTYTLNLPVCNSFRIGEDAFKLKIGGVVNGK